MWVKKFLFLLDPINYLFFVSGLITILTWISLRRKKSRFYFFRAFKSLSNKSKLLISFLASWVVVVTIVTPGLVAIYAQSPSGFLQKIGRYLLAYFEFVSQPFEAIFSKIPFESLPTSIQLAVGISTTLVMAFILVLPIILIVGSISLLLVRQSSRKNKGLFFVQYIILTFINTIIIGFLSFGLYIWTDQLQKECERRFWDEQFVFNAHLTDLCVNREDTSECPRNVAELRAFNPKSFDAAQQCTDWEYWYSEEKGHFWAIRQSFNRYFIPTSDSRYPSKDFFTHWEIQRLKRNNTQE